MIHYCELKSIVYLDYLDFFTLVFFSVPGSHPWYHVTFSFQVILGSSYLWQFLRFFILMTLTVCEEYWSGISSDVPLMGCAWFFLIIRLQLWVWGRRSQRESAIYNTSYWVYILSIWFMTVMLNLVSCYKVIKLFYFPPFHVVLFGKKSLCGAYT